ncbi:MAG: MBL fold metallo-hydrolase [Treponemataceae bacterium]|nr:MAG: MBL fold metallo-hydrolase [Treponemataceae bacterium]
MPIDTESFNTFSVAKVTGAFGGDAFLVIVGHTTFLVETGYAFSANELLVKLQAALGGRALDYILITHSHFDHAGGTPAIKQVYPDAQVVSSEIAAQIFQKPTAHSTMRELDKKAAMIWGKEQLPDLFASLKTDIAVSDGYILRTGDVTVRVIAMPGHTRCCLGYYFEEIDLLVTTETSGVYIFGKFYPTYVISYKQSLAAIEKIEEISPAYILSPHYGVIKGDEAKRYAGNARITAQESAQFILTRHNEGKSEDEILEDYTDRYYNRDLKDTGIQSEEAFLINSKVMITRVIEECGGKVCQLR